MAGSSAPPEAPRYPYVSIEEVSAWEAGEEKANTTIGCLVTNARLTKAEACRVADLAHTGIARTIDPPHTSVDGDALFLLSTQKVEATPDLVAELGTKAVTLAIRNAVN
jgi:L-aminopeptidase/D-esterase-like protein